VSCVAPVSLQRPARIRRGAGLAVDLFGEIDVDNFAGGGGVGMGFELATGKAFDVAINHDPKSIEMHQANHPHTRHLCESVWAVDPVELAAGRRVRLAWFSPDCKHFSRAKGAKPVEKKIRGLAWVAVRWAKRVRPRIIMLENVREFQDWGPLTAEHRPCPMRKSQTFKRFVSALRNLGYEVEWRVLNAADYGAPTHRRRLFLIARSDGRAIVWPEKTHGVGLKPYRTAASCIDWSIPCPSIFDRKRPLAEKTLRRIALGIIRYVLNNPRPFIVNIERSYKDFAGQAVDVPLNTITAYPKGGKHALVTPTLVQTGYSERDGQAPRALDIEKPLGTVVASGKHALVSAMIAKHYGGVVGHEPERPLGTVTAVDHHSVVAATLTQFRGSNNGNGGDVTRPAPTQTAENRPGLVCALLTKWYGNDQHGQAVDTPAHTLTAKDRLGLLTVTLDDGQHGVVVKVPKSKGVEGGEYVIADIGLRMLTPRELARCQGFPDSYVLTGTQSNQVARIGNSVPPQVVQALVRANVTKATASERSGG
jgi:DNA (cytosine-5)-methyltransferase 1